jgi:cell division septal protein FtsQ
MFKKSPLKSSKLVKRKRRILYAKIWLSVAAFLLFVGGLAWLSRLHVLAIDSVVVKGNSAVSESDINEIVQAHIRGAYAFLIPRSNRLLYPKEAIAASVLHSLKRVEAVDLNVDGNDLVVTLSERKPSYVWCAGHPETSGTKDCYFLDESGLIFSSAPQFSGNAYVAFYGIVKDENPIGSMYLARDVFKDFDRLIEFLNSKDAHPYALVASEDGLYELYLERGGKLLFKSGQDMAVLISNVELIMKNTELFSKKNASKLQYIDFRFGNKVYYKLSGDKMLQISQ